MKIALDYDNTYTADKELWNKFINTVLSTGHQIFIVTMRCRKHDWNEELAVLDKNLSLPVIFCDGVPKRQVCEELGVHVDIWIDDFPEGIHLGSQYSPAQLEEWRTEQKASSKVA